MKMQNSGLSGAKYVWEVTVGKMTTCRQCGGQLSIHAEMCPHCGAAGYYAHGPNTDFWVVLEVVLFVAVLMLCLGIAPMIPGFHR
jgi:hypothetical protein